MALRPRGFTSAALLSAMYDCSCLLHLLSRSAFTAPLTDCRGGLRCTGCKAVLPGRYRLWTTMCAVVMAVRRSLTWQTIRCSSSIRGAGPQTLSHSRGQEHKSQQRPGAGPAKQMCPHVLQGPVVSKHPGSPRCWLRNPRAAVPTTTAGAAVLVRAAAQVSSPVHERWRHLATCIQVSVPTACKDRCNDCRLSVGNVYRAAVQSNQVQYL